MRKIFLVFLSLSFSAGAASQEINQYPTMESVRIVVNCMQEVGGQSEETLYTCACRHDVIAKHMTYNDYEQGRLYERHRDMSGKKGGIMRDAAGHARKLFNELKEVRKKAEQACPVVRHIEAPRLEQGERVTDEEMQNE